jgi:hypothetical protein
MLRAAVEPNDNRILLSMRDTSNTPLEWTGRHQISAYASLYFLPATQGQR